jgi:YD repeat-containing protein
MKKTTKSINVMLARGASHAPLFLRLSRFASSYRSLINTGCITALLALPVSHAYGGSVSYTYDALGRLATAVYNNGIFVTYNYDAAGNWTLVTTTAP